MKKYLSGLLAVILAVGFSAFTAADVDEVYFEYVGSDFADPDEVSKHENWVQVSDPEELTCDSVDEIPCAIQLPDETYGVDDDNDPFTPNILDENQVTLVLSFNMGTGTYYVNPITPSIETIDIAVSNREKP